MKKLTAGIFATILGLTAMGAADAAVTSKGYVDAAVKAVSTTAAGLDGRLTTAEGKITAAEGKITTIEGQQTTQDGLIQANTAAIDAIEADYLKAADKTTLQNNIDAVSAVADAAATKTELTDGLALKADKAKVGELPADATATTVVGYIQEKTANIASEGTVTELAGRVTTAEGKITTIEGQQTTQDGLIQANTDAIDAIEADYLKTADKTELQGDIDAVDGRVTTAEGKITTIEGQQTTQDGLIQANTDAIDAIEADYLKAADKTELQNAIDAVEGGVEDITGAADNTTTGKYALTKIVAEDGAVSYGWELIDRDYDEADVTPNGQ